MIMKRVTKIMSERGLASRREAEEMIAQGWVTVDGVTVDHPSFKANDDCEIKIAQQALELQEDLATILLHKPVGYVSSQAEDDYIPAVRLLQPQNQAMQGAYQKLRDHHFNGLAVAGRLDIDSRGLLVFTQNGLIAKKLIGAQSEIEKEYIILTQEKVNAAQVRHLNGPLELEGVALRPALVEQLAPNKLRFVLIEGKKRQVRRMCQLVGLHVTSLIRVRIGQIKLGTLPSGQWRFLQPGEEF